MIKRRMNRAHLFLMELIIVIAFFSFAGAITVQVFAQAKINSEEAATLDSAVFASQNYLEVLRAKSDEAFIQWLSTLDQASLTEEIQFDQQWRVVNGQAGDYGLYCKTAIQKVDGGLLAKMDITVKQLPVGDTVYQCSSARFVQWEDGGQDG